MKKIILTFIATLLAGFSTAWAQNVASVNGTPYTTLADALNAARVAAAGGWNTTSVTVEILDDITFASDAEWTPIVYNQLNPITINGNGKTITNLPGMLYAKSGSGVSTLTINDLTFEYPKVSLTTDYAAVIMGYADCVKGLYFNNVHIDNATVTGANYVAGFVGYAAGYSNTNDGPVFQNVEFNNCSVTNSTFTSTGGGSVGALMGHAAGSTDSRIEVEETTVSGNTISTTKASKAGALFGTVGAAGPTGDHPEAGIYVSADVSDNDVTANGTTITTIYGRQGTPTGRLTLTDGGSYDSAPIAVSDAGWASTEDGEQLIQNPDGSYTVEDPSVAKIGNNKFETLQAAVDAAQDGDQIDILKDFTLTTVTTNPSNKYNVEINKSVTINGNGKTITSSTGKRALVLTGAGKQVTIKDLTVASDKAEACLWIADALTCNLDNTTLDGTNGVTYNQPLTIGTIESADRVVLNIVNGSVIKTNDNATAHYAIIVWHPSDITVTESTLKGYSNVYIKPGGAGSIVNISESTLTSQGIKGNTNSFAMFVTEGGDNTFTLTDNAITVNAAENTYETLFQLNSTTGNTVMILGSNTTYTSNDEEYGALTFNWGSLMEDQDNNVYFDAATKALFTPYVNGASGVSISDETVSVSDKQLYPLNYAPEVFYYWANGEDSYQGVYCSFADPFVDTENYILGDGEFIRLMKDVELTQNITIPLQAEESITITLGDYTITKGDYSVKLIKGVSVITDKQTDIFSAADANLFVVETKNEDGTYTYMVGNDVYWSWTDGDGRTGYYDYFHSPFDSDNTTGTDEMVELQRNVTMTADITCGRVGGTLYLKFGNYTVNRNGFHVLLPAPRVWEARAMVPSDEGGVTIYTDQITDIFAAAESGYTILVAPSDDPNYAYAYQVVEVDDENAVARNKKTGILYTDLQLAIDQAAAGNTIELLEGIENVTLTKTVNINKSITIEGGDYQVTSEVTTGALYGPRLDPAFHITGPGSVTLNKMNIVAPYVVPGHDGPGIYDQYTSGSVGIVVDRQFNDSLVINYSTITTTGRGIDILSVGGGFVLDVKHSTITTTDDDPDTAYGEEDDEFDPTTVYINSFDGDPFGRGRGINFGNDAVTCVANIQFSQIQGYAYPINIADNSGKLILNMTDCSTWGRDVINNWGDNGSFKLKNITAHGYNNENVEEVDPAQESTSTKQNNESFAAIVDYKTADLNFYDIESLRVVANVKAADADSTSASENFIDLRGINATVKISGNSGYEIADSLKDRVGFVNNNLSDDDVSVGETNAYKRMIDKSANNRVYFDDQSKAYFNYWFEILEPFMYKLNADEDSVEIRIGIDDEKDYTNLYPVVPLRVNVMLTITLATEDEEESEPMVFYYEKLQDAFNNELFSSESAISREITIMNNIEMDEDITPNLKRGENFTLSSIKDDSDGETWLYSITPGDYHIFLNPLVTAFYDDMAGNGSDLFAPSDSVNTTILGEESVYYTAANVYWAGDVEEIEGMYWLFDELFNYKEDDLNPYFTPGTYTRLEMDINLERNVKLPTGAGMDIIEVDDDDTTGTDTSTEEEETGDETYQYWLDFNITDENPMGYAIYKGDYSIILQLGQEVYTTAPTDIFSSFDPEYSVVYDSVSVEKFNEDSVTVTFLYKYYLLKDGLAITVDPATYCGDRLTPNFTVKKKVTTEEVDPNDDTQTINKDTWVELTKSLTKEEYDQMVDDGEDVSGYDYFWYLVPPVDENDSTTYISAKTYVQALVIEGISFQGIRKADFTILPRDIKDVTVDGNIQPWREEGYTPAQIDSLISLVYECIEHSSDTTLTKYDEETKKGDYRIAVVDSTYIDYNTYAKVITITAVEGGNYTGTLKLDFTILPEGLVDISKCMVVSKAVYNSLKQAPTYDLIEVVYMNGSDKVVLEPEQFEIELHGDSADYVDAKTYSNAMTLRGTTQPGATDTLRFFGTVVADYVIAQRDLADTIFTDDFVEVILEKNKDMEWSGDDLTKMIKIGDSDDSTNNVFLYMKVNDDNYHYALTNDESINKFDYSYTVDPSPMINPGEYRVIFTGRGNFTGMREMTINVLKDINLIADGINVDLQIIPDNYRLYVKDLKGIEVKDGNKKLIEGVHYTIEVKGARSNTTPYTYRENFSNPDAVAPETYYEYIQFKGVLYAFFKGKEPYYTDTVMKEFPVVYEYYAYDDEQTCYNLLPSGNYQSSGLVLNNPNNPNRFSFRVKSGKLTPDGNTWKCEGEATVSAIDKIKNGTYSKTSLDPTQEIRTLDNEVKVAVGDKQIKFNIVGIEDNAFRDLPRIHCLDATKLVGYTPTTLSRTSDGPFNHYPLQSLVYLDGDDYKGTNYIYKTLTEGFRCEELKIYDDTQGNQQTVRTSTGGASWEFRNIYLFTADKVTNTRYFTNGQHYTTCLPYELQMTSDLKAYTLDAASDNIFGFKQYKASKLDRFTPYVLIPSKSGNLLSNAEKTVVYVTPNVNRGFLPLDDNNNRRYDFKTPTGHIMYGTNVYMGWTSTNPVIFDLYIMQSKNTWKKIPATRQSTYNNACILPMRAYIMLPSHPQSNGYVQINPEDVINSGGYPSRELMPAKYIDVDDDATAINDIAENEDWSNAEVYDLQGRKVDTTVNLPKGVYIVNGQKRIKK